MSARSLVPRLVLAACLLLPAGCGDDPSPAEGAPELAGLLVLVDEAVADRRWPAAREAIRRLVERTDAAEQEGSLTAEQADRIRAAARDLLAGIPEPTRAPASTTPSPSPSPSGGSGGSGGSGQGGNDKPSPGKKGGKGGKGGGKKP